MRRFMFLFAFLLASPLQAQSSGGWGNLDNLLVASLSPTGLMEASFWMPDAANPDQAQLALGIAYVHIPGSAGITTLEAGLFGRTPTGWVLQRRVSDLFGHSPTAPAFAADRIELTTMMLGPNDPRCCPTKPTRWSISKITGQAVPLN